MPSKDVISLFLFIIFKLYLMTSCIHKRSLKTGNPNKLLEGAIRLLSCQERSDQTNAISEKWSSMIHWIWILALQYPPTQQYYKVIPFSLQELLKAQITIRSSHLIHPSLNSLWPKIQPLHVFSNFAVSFCLHSALLVASHVSKTRSSVFEVMSSKHCTARTFMKLPIWP